MQVEQQGYPFDAVKKLRSSGGVRLGSDDFEPVFDLVNMDDLLAPQCNNMVDPIDVSEGFAAWPPSLRFSFETVFQNELALAGSPYQGGTSSNSSSSTLALDSAPLPPPLAFAMDDTSALAMDCSSDHTLGDSSSDATHASSSFKTKIDMDENSDEALRTLQQLIESEQLWEERLQQLYRSYKPGQGQVGASVALVKKEIDSEIHNIDNLLDTSVLEVKDLYTALSLKDRCATVLQKCNVLENEEHYYGDRDVGAQQLVSLVWVSQPLPRSFKMKNRARDLNRKKKGHCSMQAQLLRAPGVTFTPTSPVTASFYLNAEEPGLPILKGRGKRTKEEMSAASSSLQVASLQSDAQIQNNVEHLQGDTVTFDFRFPTGTHNRPCSIRLHVRGIVHTADGASKEVEIVSEPTHRFIVTTHESQYEVAELKLMAIEIFPRLGQETCSWARFVNALNLRWMRVTRQESESAVECLELDRTLAQEDLQYISRRFFGKAPTQVAYSQLVDFYKFFGKVTHVYRHNAAVRTMLLEGLFWGFLSKQEATERLQSLQPGSFVIRSSDDEPGSFTISWHDAATTKIRHARLDSKLWASARTAPLADYIASKPFLQYVYTPFVRHQKESIYRPTLRLKDDAFGPHYAAKGKKKVTSKQQVVAKKPVVKDGYDDMDML